MNRQLMESIKKSMLDHLRSKGWPDLMTNDQIIQEIPSLWQKLSSEGLLVEPIKQGLTYQHFLNIALHKKNQHETMEEVAAFFRRGNGHE